MVSMLSFGAVAAGSSGEMQGEVSSMKESSDGCPFSRLFVAAQKQHCFVERSAAMVG